ncbi:uncharacterized protein DSM5745_02873 [Aspergillus mulundensis]|uniref:BTB domain-containing protein n=1 Tax=Aspergillus mulundensis TaxID=1810919 RepID=A0A3D8SJ81_9EURO|nr:Uncharacterized protein DSM5745_02873 [Aspergillus mulundensis]RDW86231.1 Uncharacterized protein DSM5745_02873 [Aspergillus mulundensis]
MAESEDTKPVSLGPVLEEKLGDLATCLKSYYRSSKFTDLTITTSEQEFKVHKLVLCSQSGYFARMFNGDWKETHTNMVKLEGDDPYFVQTMIESMYGIEYTTADHGVMSTMMFHVAAYQIADKYDVPNLKDYAKKKFEHAVKANWAMDDFPPTIVEVYRTTPMSDRGLRDPIVRVVGDHYFDLTLRESFMKVLEEAPGFGADMTRHFCVAFRPPGPPEGW